MKPARLAAFVLGMVLAGSVHAGAYDDMIVAIRNGDAAKVISLLQRGMDVNTADAHGMTLAMHAARSGNDKLLEYLLINGANPLIKNNSGDTAINLAALYGHVDCLRLLTAAGAGVNPPPGSWTPLNYAAFGGHAVAVAYLIESGARVDERAPNGMTSLMLAGRNGHVDVVRLLLQRQADVRLTMPDGRKAGDIAAEAGNTVIAEMLAIQAMQQH